MKVCMIMFYYFNGMKIFFSSTLIFIFFFSFLSQAEAATVLVDWPKEAIAPGSTLNASFFLETEKPVNALEGDLVLEGATIERVEEAGSALLFWIKKPTIEVNRLHFSGVTPGGIPLGKRLLFKLVIKTNEEGRVAFTGSNLQALLNDGLGTPEALSLKNNSLLVEKGNVPIILSEKKDTTPPEAFSILQSRSDDLAEGKWFISFATLDKQTGILGYEVEESIIPPYFWFLLPREKKIVESPYVVLGQGRTYVLVRAIDLSGNTRESLLSPQVPLFWYLVMGVLVMIGVLLYVVRRRKR